VDESIVDFSAGIKYLELKDDVRYVFFYVFFCMTCVPGDFFLCTFV
jgi:hypothetical protein